MHAIQSYMMMIELMMMVIMIAIMMVIMMIMMMVIRHSLLCLSIDDGDVDDDVSSFTAMFIY